MSALYRLLFASLPPRDSSSSISIAFVRAALAGLLVGVVESSYALYFSARSTESVAVAALILAVTSLAAGALATIVATLLRIAHWGSLASPRFAPSALSTALSAVGAGALCALASAWIAPRKHALLGALVLSLIAATAAVALWCLSLGLQRVLSSRAHHALAARAPSSPLWPRAVTIAAVASIVVCSVARACAWPLTVAGQRAITASASLAALLAPWIAITAAPWLARRSKRSILAAAAIATTAALVAAIVGLRSVVALVPLGIAPWISAPVAWWIAARVVRSEPRRAATLAIIAAQLIALSAATQSEFARKVIATRALGAELALSAIRAGLDWDRDGYARWIAGGDCRDDDAAVHPGAMDWPGDGVDSDCDGRDDRVSLPPQRPFIVVPDAIVARPNVLLLTIDALRADHLGAYGYARDTSRSLDALARESVVFDRAFANAPSTRLSMPAIATGRWAPAIEWDLSVWWPRFTAKQRTVAQALHDIGYRTGAVYSIPYFRRTEARGFERGVDEYDDSHIALHSEVGGPHESTGTSSREVADSAISFVERNRERPWFLWAHFFDPHHQYVSHHDGRTPEYGSAPIDRYDAEVHYTDQHIGRLLDRLRASGQWARTVIVVTGDHGEGFGEHDVQTHGFHLYAAQTRVPMIVRVPGALAKRSSVAVSHVDIAPTIANLTGASNERTFLGRSMVDAIAYSTRPSDDGEALQEVTFDHTVHRWAIATSTHHVLWNQTPDSTRQCYDLRRDPDERHDLFGLVGVGAPCDVLFDQLSRYAVGLRLGPDFADKLAFGVIAPDARTPPVEHPLEARFGTVVDVRGWDGPTSVARDQDATFTVHFTVIDRIEPGWEQFVHLMGAQTSRNLQHAMIEGTYPIDRWRPGQRLRDRFTFHIASDTPPGQYALVMGFYKGDERLPIHPPSRGDALRRVQLGSIEVR